MEPSQHTNRISFQEALTKLDQAVSDLRQDRDSTLARVVAGRVILLKRSILEASINDAELNAVKLEMGKALGCLYISVDESVARDVAAKVNAYVSLLENQLTKIKLHD